MLGSSWRRRQSLQLPMQTAAAAPNTPVTEEAQAACYSGSVCSLPEGSPCCQHSTWEALGGLGAGTEIIVRETVTLIAAVVWGGPGGPSCAQGTQPGPFPPTPGPSFIALHGKSSLAGLQPVIRCLGKRIWGLC